MSQSNDDKLLELRKIVRCRLSRDLRALESISRARQELSLRELLDELHNVYVHYLQLDTLLNNASAAIHRDNTKLQEEINKLRSIDGN